MDRHPRPPDRARACDGEGVHRAQPEARAAGRLTSGFSCHDAASQRRFSCVAKSAIPRHHLAVAVDSGAAGNARESFPNQAAMNCEHKERGPVR